MQTLLNTVLTLGIPIVGLLIAYRVWSYAAASGNKSPGKVVSSLLTMLIVFAAGMVVIPRVLNWGSTMFMSQMMANPGVQSGISLMGTGAGLIDQTLSVPSGSAPQIQVPHIQLPQTQPGAAVQPQSFVVPPSNGAAANQGLQHFVQEALQGAQPVASGQATPIAPAEQLSALQQQAVATGRAVMAVVEQAAASSAGMVPQQLVATGPYANPEAAFVPAGTVIERFVGPYKDPNQAVQSSVVGHPQAFVPPAQPLVLAPAQPAIAPVRTEPTLYIAPPTVTPAAELFVGPYKDPKQAVVSTQQQNTQLAGLGVVTERFVGPYANAQEAVQKVLVQRDGELVWVEKGE